MRKTWLGNLRYLEQTALFVIVGIGILFTLFFWDQNKADQRVLDETKAIWEEPLARALVQEDWLFSARIGQGLNLSRFYCAEILKGATRVFAYPSEPVSCACDAAYERTLSHYGVEVGKIVACSNAKTKAQVVLSDSNFQISSLLVLLIAALASVIPLNRYRRSLLSTIELLTVWSDKPNSSKELLDELSIFGGEDQLTKRLGNLFALVVNQQVELQFQRGELEKQRLLSDLARQVSHDIRSPLSALNIATSRLSEESDEVRKVIQGAACRINRIANDLLKKSQESVYAALSCDSVDRAVIANDRLESTCGDAAEAPVSDLVAIVQSIVNEKAVEFSDRPGLTFIADLTDQSKARARVYPVELERALSNLINNSAEAIDETGTVTVAIRSFKDSVALIVSDNGRGIPDQILGRLGEMGATYGKLASSKASNLSGSGLGVYHAKRTTERFGGRFAVQSRSGVGTMVTMSFPGA